MSLALRYSHNHGWSVMPQPRKNQISLIDTPITIVFPAVFAVRFCVAKINLRDRVANIDVVR
jgi:hypothetical protein